MAKQDIFHVTGLNGNFTRAFNADVIHTLSNLGFIKYSYFSYDVYQGNEPVGPRVKYYIATQDF